MLHDINRRIEEKQCYLEGSVMFRSTICLFEKKYQKLAFRQKILEQMIKCTTNTIVLENQ